MLVPAPHITGAPEIMPGEMGTAKICFFGLKEKINFILFKRQTVCLFNQILSHFLGSYEVRWKSSRGREESTGSVCRNHPQDKIAVRSPLCG